MRRIDSTRPTLTASSLSACLNLRMAGCQTSTWATRVRSCFFLSLQKVRKGVSQEGGLPSLQPLGFLASPIWVGLPLSPCCLTCRESKEKKWNKWNNKSESEPLHFLDSSLRMVGCKNDGEWEQSKKTASDEKGCVLQLRVRGTVAFPGPLP